jgi:20S proteasome alpha/beta subunit
LVLSTADEEVDLVHPLTIIIGLKCEDGVVIASDSQQEFGRGVSVKRLNTGKIYLIGDRFAFAGAGVSAHIEKAVDAIDMGIKEGKKHKAGADLSEDECVSAMERSMLAIYKVYNIERAKFLGDPKEKEFFSPILIVGCVEAANGQTKGKLGNHCLFIVHSEGVVEKISDYATAGSGAAYAELHLKNSYVKGMKVQEATALAYYVIEEVKSIDVNCGETLELPSCAPRTASKS